MAGLFPARSLLEGNNFTPGPCRTLSLPRTRTPSYCRYNRHCSWTAESSCSSCPQRHSTVGRGTPREITYTPYRTVGRHHRSNGCPHPKSTTCLTCGAETPQTQAPSIPSATPTYCVLYFQASVLESTLRRLTALFQLQQASERVHSASTQPQQRRPTAADPSTVNSMNRRHQVPLAMSAQYSLLQDT